MTSVLRDTISPPLPVPWANVVWSRNHLSRFAFILWIAFWERLPTLQKLSQWGIADSNLCHLCHRHIESQAHLFFHCSFSRKVWMSTTNKLNCRTIEFQWDSLLGWLLNYNWCSNFQKDLVYLSLAITVYHLWKERNQRFHTNTTRSEDFILGEVLQSIRLAVSSWRKVRKTHNNWDIALNLGLHISIFNNG